MRESFDYIIAGGGIMGLSIARTIASRAPSARILVIEKEAAVAEHASGRSSGVLHAGFYYTADSLKARFSVAGNQALRTYCTDRKLPLNACGKLVVATTEAEVEQLHELKRRGDKNGSNVELISEDAARKLNPAARTLGSALWSPMTATVNARQVCESIRSELETAGVRDMLNTPFLGREGSAIRTSAGTFDTGMFINCAGLHADRIAHQFGFGTAYTIVPFKGLYLKYSGKVEGLRTHIYPVPNLGNPFLGVHFTLTADDKIKIGPTAIPAFWRENYSGFSRFDLQDFVEIVYQELRLFATNAFGFRSLAFEEMRKYSRAYLVSLAQRLASSIDPRKFDTRLPAGIRAQLLDKRSLKLVQDFIVEGDSSSVHVLNAVSPGFTCSFPFAEHIVSERILPEKSRAASAQAEG